MKMKIVAGAIALSLVSSMAGAATMTLLDRKEALVEQYGRSWEHANSDIDEMIANERPALIEQEAKRMNQETEDYFAQHMRNAVTERRAEQEKAVKAETDKYIREIKKYIDSLQ